MDSPTRHMLQEPIPSSLLLFVPHTNSFLKTSTKTQVSHKATPLSSNCYGYFIRCFLCQRRRGSCHYLIRFSPVRRRRFLLPRGEDAEDPVEIAADHIPAAHVSIGEIPSSPDLYAFRSDPLPDFGSESNGGLDNGAVFVSDEPILPPPSEMQPDEGFILREWRRQNAMILEDKEKKEKEQREQIIVEAQQYKEAFYEKRKLNVETSKVQNCEKEKLFKTSQEKFHADADKQYWKAISELIPHEIANIEKKRGKKEKENKPSITVMQGPKPGKPTDMSRMRQILVKLKHNPPPHMKLPETTKEPAKEVGPSNAPAPGKENTSVAPKVTVPVPVSA